MSKKPEKKSDRTRREILEATIDCIAQIGVEKTSITAIAERAQVSRGLVAHYFPVKDELFMYVIRYIWEIAIEKIEARHRTLASPSESPDPFQDIVASLRANLDFFVANPRYFRCVFLFFYFAAIDREYRRYNTELFTRTYARMTQDVKNLLASRKITGVSDVEARNFAESLHRDMQGAVFKFYYFEGVGEKDAFKEELMGVLSGRVEGFLALSSRR